MISHLSGHPVFPPPTVAGAAQKSFSASVKKDRVDRFVGTLLGKGNGDRSSIPIERREIIVVQGRRDDRDIDEILDLAAIPYTAVSPLHLDEELLEGAKLVFVNCNLSSPPGLAERLAGWVLQKGGLLSICDHGLGLVEKGFRNVKGEPLFVRHHNDIYAKADDFGPLSLLNDVCDIDENDPLAELFFEKGEKARWTVHDDYWPVHIVDPTRVKVLARSPAFGKRYDGKDALMLRVDFENRGGRLYHVVGHWKHQILGTPSESSRKSGGKSDPLPCQSHIRPKDPQKRS